MSMVKFTVDTTNKLFVAKAGITAFDVKIDLYSDAKEHWLSGGAAMGFLFPIRVIGGDPVGGGKFAGDLYFLRDGWKIRPDEADHTLTITGNLFLDEGEVGNLIVPTVGDFTVVTIAERSNLVLAVNTGGTIAPSQQDIRDAMTLATAAGIAPGSIDARLPSVLTGGRMESNVGSITDGVLTAATFAQSALDAIADAVLTRNVSAVEATAAKTTIAGIVLKLMSRTKMTATELEIYRTNGTTLFATQARVIDLTLQPTGQLGVSS